MLSFDQRVQALEVLLIPELPLLTLLNADFPQVFHLRAAVEFGNSPERGHEVMAGVQASARQAHEGRTDSDFAPQIRAFASFLQRFPLSTAHLNLKGSFLQKLSVPEDAPRHWTSGVRVFEPFLESNFSVVPSRYSLRARRRYSTTCLQLLHIDAFHSAEGPDAKRSFLRNFIEPDQLETVHRRRNSTHMDE